jgi:hypothetical protein
LGHLDALGIHGAVEEEGCAQEDPEDGEQEEEEEARWKAGSIGEM